MKVGRHRRRWRALPAAAIVAAAGLGIGACSGPATPAAGGSGQPGSATPAPSVAVGPPPTTVAGYYAQKLRWHTCDKQFQCARLLVPFDYKRPAWRRFSLPVIRLPASDPAHRIGSLVLNPGGPGGSGIAYALQARSVVSAAVRARFDIVGFDPRGVGASIPAVNCLTGPQLDTYFATSDNPTSPAQLSTLVSQSKLFARGCERDSGALLPYVGTANAARDMDVLRAALGDAKLTYLGKSYGTYLGTWYAHLFPTHIRAMVLDGAVDPSESSLDLNKVQAEGFQVALKSFISSCLHLAGCPLGHGGTVTAAIAKLQGLLNRAARKPLVSQVAGQPANQAMLLGGVAASLYSTTYWPYLRAGLTAAFSGDGTIMVELADALEERSPNGHYTNLAAANMAVNCVDRPWPHNLATWRAAAASAAKSAPQFGTAIMWSSLPCAYWPVPAAKPVALRGAGAPPILVIGNTKDPATPFQWAQALSRDLKSGVLLGWNGNGHTAYMMGSSCIDNAVDRYLINLIPPASGTMCP